MFFIYFKGTLTIKMATASFQALRRGRKQSLLLDTP